MKTRRRSDFVCNNFWFCVSFAMLIFKCCWGCDTSNCKTCLKLTFHLNDSGARNMCTQNMNIVFVCSAKHFIIKLLFSFFYVCFVNHNCLQQLFFNVKFHFRLNNDFNNSKNKDTVYTCYSERRYSVKSVISFLKSQNEINTFICILLLILCKLI